jgi:hypothetical protein
MLEWLRYKINECKTHIFTKLIETATKLLPYQKLFIPINIVNEHFTLLAVMRNSQNNLIGVCVDSECEMSIHLTYL